jgi:hypothetical protein
MKFKLLLGLAALWVVIIIGIIIYTAAHKSKPINSNGQTSNTSTQSSPYLQQPSPGIINRAEVQTDPKSSNDQGSQANPNTSNTQGSQTNPNNIVQDNSAIGRLNQFFSLINDGKLDGAASMVDPNTLMVAISNQKDKDAREDMLNYVKIFTAGDMVSSKVLKQDNISIDEIIFTVELAFKKGNSTKIAVTMHNLILDKVTGNGGWFVKSMVVPS